MEKNRNRYNLSVREIDILYVLWKADRPLLASEIVEADEKLKIAYCTYYAKKDAR